MRITVASQATWVLVSIAALATIVAWPPIVAAQQAAEKQASGPTAVPNEPAKTGAPLKVPPLDEFLERAMAGHPEIEAARARVELAESELRQTQFRVARELMELRSAWEPQAQNVARLELLSKRGNISFHELSDARAKLAPLDAQITALLRRKPAALHAPVAAVEPRVEFPHGAIAEQMDHVLAASVEVGYIDTPLTDALEYLGHLTKIKLMIVDSPESNTPISIDQPLTLELTGVPLGAVLQAIEDLTGNVRFVLRDYGIVATSKDSALAIKAVSAVQRWKERPLEKPREPAANK